MSIRVFARSRCTAGQQDSLSGNLVASAHSEPFSTSLCDREGTLLDADIPSPIVGYFQPNAVSHP
jgi:hypothetical protein